MIKINKPLDPLAGLHQKIRIVYGADGHAHEFVHPLRHTHLAPVPWKLRRGTQRTQRHGPKELDYNIVQDKHKIVQHNNLLIFFDQFGNVRSAKIQK